MRDTILAGAMRLIATCPEETKPALVQELEALGATGLLPGFRAVSFDASDELFYELHLKLRTASRILRVVKEVPAKTRRCSFRRCAAFRGASCSMRSMASWWRASVPTLRAA
jgi:23S rRNA G2445 N2-methylase RlmL